MTDLAVTFSARTVVFVTRPEPDASASLDTTELNAKAVSDVTKLFE